MEPVLPEGFSDETLANNFADFFEQKVNMIVEDINVVENWEPSFPTVTGNSLQKFEKINRTKIESIIHKVKYTFCDLDPLPFGDLRNSSNLGSLLDVFVHLVNLCFDSNIYPSTEKGAMIKPSLKGSLDKQALNSYRPVSNLPFLSKIIEKVILEQLLDFMDKNGTLPDNQSAYRQLYSVETTLCSVVNDLLIGMDDGKCSILILLDLSAAFDTVVHSILCSDLNRVGVVGDALELLKDYLQNRYYNVKIGNSLSNTKSLDRGVPQGSVLGPILFCIYTIELSHIMYKYGAQFRLFADDTQFYLTITNIEQVEEKITMIIADIKKWMDYKKLKLNETKTECLILGKKSDLMKMNVNSIKIMENEVIPKKSVRNLGVIFDETLCFKEQINQISRVAGYHLRNISFLKKYLDESTLKKLIHNFVITRLDFCNSLYYELPDYTLKKLQRIQNRAARLIKGIPPRNRITPVLIELHWLPIKARIIFKICTLTFQSMKYNKPLYMRDMLVDFDPSTSMGLRHRSEVFRLEHQRSRLQVGSRAFQVAAPRLMNWLPQSIKMSENIEIFKRKLKTFLFNECFDFTEMKINDPYKL